MGNEDRTENGKSCPPESGVITNHAKTSTQTIPGCAFFSRLIKRGELTTLLDLQQIISAILTAGPIWNDSDPRGYQRTVAPLTDTPS